MTQAATQTRERTNGAAPPPPNGQAPSNLPANPQQTELADGPLARFGQPRLPYHPELERRFGITRAQWKVLVDP